MKIKKIIKYKYEEIRISNGHKTEGIGEYKKREVSFFQVGDREFKDRTDAKNFIKRILNKNKISSLETKRKKILKELLHINKKLYSLGVEPLV